MTRRRLIVLAAATPVILAGTFLAVQGLRAKAELDAVTRLAGPVEQAIRDGQDPDLRPLRQHAHAAVGHTDGWLWGAAEHVPFFGDDLQAVRRSAGAVDGLTRDALPPLESALQTLRGDSVLVDGRVDLGVLARVHGQVRSARPAVAAAHREVSGLHAHFVDGRLSDLQRRVGRLDDAMAQADDAMAQAPALLGAGADRRYLVVVQNNAEARATGGLIGAVGELSARDGRLELVRTLTDDQLHSARRPVPDDPAASRTWVTIGSTLAWFDTNLTPHVPDAARNVAGLWQAQTGQRVDGVVFVDAVSLQHLMRAPVALPGGGSVAPADVVDFICRREYVDYPDNNERKQLLRVLAGTIVKRATSGGDLDPLADAARSGHLLAWFARPAEQRLVTGRLVGGTLPVDGSAYLQVLTQDFAGNKLDYYLHRKVLVRREGDGLRVTVELRNEAPDGLPAYMALRSDRPVPPVPYGQDRVGMSLYGGKGARFEQPTLDGHPAQGMQVDVDHGLGFATIELEVPRDRPVVFSVLLKGPGGLLTYRQQPLVRPDDLELGLD
ncbi:MAG: DUF4012 domain-containing protein, partial [Actinomycetota bacterium]|nr:DUF4012 domain-containing protein [Actinomycetota bacterium]